MKKIICLVMVVCLAGLCGCGDKNKDPRSAGQLFCCSPHRVPICVPCASEGEAWSR